MSRRSARLQSRRRTLVFVCLAVLVWCQLVASAHATSMAVASLRGHAIATQMASMPGCGDEGDSGHAGKPPCPASEAMSDWATVPVFHALPLASLFFGVSVAAPTYGPADFQWPRGQAPPRSRLCCWLI